MAFAVLPPLWPAAKLFTLEQPARPGSPTGLAAAFFAGWRSTPLSRFTRVSV